MDWTDSGLSAAWLKVTDGPAARDLRYCDTSGQWYVWARGRWQVDDKRARYSLAKGWIDSLQPVIPPTPPSDADAETKAAHKAATRDYAGWLRRRNHAPMTALLNSLASERQIATRPAEWDADPYVLSTPDGIVDLRTGRVRPATRVDLMAKCTKVSPDWQVEPSRWLQFIDEITCGDRELAAYLRRAIGMTICGTKRDHVIMICNGIGANGKSQLIETLVEALGDYGCLAMPNLLSARTQEAHPTELMQLKGARLVYCDEVKGNRLDESKIKRMTGARSMTARGMNQDPQTFAVTWTVWADCNAQPTISGTDEGIWRRIRLLPFNAHYPEGSPKRDPHLPDKLRAEMPQILAWCIDAARDYLRDGLGQARAVIEATQNYRNDQDVLFEFLDVCTDRSCEGDQRHKVRSGFLHDVVSVYMTDYLGYQRPWSKRKLTMELTRRGNFATAKEPGGTRYIVGLRLHDDWRARLELPAPTAPSGWIN